MLSLDEVDISPVLDRVRVAGGIDFSVYRESTLRRRICRRMVSCHCEDMASYISLLDDDSDEINRLVSDLTIKWTELFRDPQVFRYLEDEVLPSTVDASRSSGESVSVWSAACATGEETYSIAALFHSSGADARILGTDVDPTAVAFATAGAYDKRLMLQESCNYPPGCFIDDGRFIFVGEPLKSRVSFAIHDLTGEDAFEKLRQTSSDRFDLVLCRNVLVYLRPGTQARVLDLCYRVLKPGGFLVLGTKEMVPAALQDRLQLYNKPNKVYRSLAK